MVTQEIKIPVRADTSGAERQADQLEQACEGVANAVKDIGAAGQVANRSLGDLLRRRAGSMLNLDPNNPRKTAEAMIDYERPKGYRAGAIDGFTTASDWSGRLAQTVRLSQMPIPAINGAPGGGQGVTVAGAVDVNIKHPDGSTETKRAPVRPVTAPQPAGLPDIMGNPGWIG